MTAARVRRNASAGTNLRLLPTVKAEAPQNAETEAPQESRGMRINELLALPAAVDLVTAGRAWGFGRTKSHEMARRGEFPCPVLRLGNAYRVTRADLLRSLGVDPLTGEDLESHQDGRADEDA